MSLLPINPSAFPDLDKLISEGYNAYEHGNVLVVEGIPYANGSKEILYGTLVSTLTMSGNKAVYQRNTGQHVIHFKGEHPCNENGTPLNMIHTTSKVTHASNHITTDFTFSRKPPNDYTDYYGKIKGYITLLMAPAYVIDNTVKAKKNELADMNNYEEVFQYIDTNSGRSNISSISDKLRDYKIGIIGLGGTGSYILDSVAKTPVQRIDLFDSDLFLNHNAFRAPGAASKEELDKQMPKVDYFQKLYSNIHKHINAHKTDIDTTSLALLKELNFVFVSIDKGEVKKLIFDFLEEQNIPFIDVGMGVEVTPQNTIVGQLRTTAVTNEYRKKYRSNIGQVDLDNELYESNIQIAELNSLNAAIAVILWKKHAGFYNESVPTGSTSFVIDTLQQNREYDEA